MMLNAGVKGSDVNLGPYWLPGIFGDHYGLPW